MFLNGKEKELFSRRNWFDVERNQKKLLEEEVASMDGNRLLNTSVDDLCTYFVSNQSSELSQSRQGSQILVREMERKLLRLPSEGKQTGDKIDDNIYRTSVT